MVINRRGKHICREIKTFASQASKMPSQIPSCLRGKINLVYPVILSAVFRPAKQGFHLWTNLRVFALFLEFF